MTPFDKSDTFQSIRDIEGAMTRYRTLVAVQGASGQDVWRRCGPDGLAVMTSKSRSEPLAGT